MLRFHRGRLVAFCVLFVLAIQARSTVGADIISQIKDGAIYGGLVEFVVSIVLQNSR